MRPKPSPLAAQEWANVEASAARMAEVAVLREREAAQSKDVDKLAAADGEFTAQCEDCHNAFRDKPGKGMMSEPGH